jgi:hypothetical protein
MIIVMLNKQSNEEEIHVTSYITNYPVEAKHQKSSASNLLPTSLLANNLIDLDSNICYILISPINYQLDY